MMPTENSGIKTESGILPDENSILSSKSERCDPRIQHERKKAKPEGSGGNEWVLNVKLMIEQLHWNYLEAKLATITEKDIPESSQEDIQKKLDKYAKEYLELVPQKLKFHNWELITEVICQAAEQDPDCNMLKEICDDFKIIEELSTHLLKIPGKVKTVQFKSNCYINFDSSDKVGLENFESFGFEGIKQGEKMLKYLGFSSTNLAVAGSKWCLHGPVDKPWVIEFARDCIMAAAECRITASILRTVVAQKLLCSWKEVLNFRQSYVGTIDQAAREIILMKTNQKLLQNAAFLESYINKKEYEKEKFVFEANQMKKEIIGLKKEIVDWSVRYESKKFTEI